MKPEHLLLPFNRPEYYSVPEALVSALCWRAYEAASDLNAASSAKVGKQVPVGYMYHAQSKKTPTVEVRATRPAGSDAGALGTELKEAHGFVTDATPRLLGETVASSILGARIDRTGNQPASPLTPALALLQDMRGITVKAGPPDYGDIIEAMFSVGSRTPPTAPASQLLLDAMDHRLEKDRFLAALDAAVMASVVPENYVRKQVLSVHERAGDWSGAYPHSPFSWFSETWETLTSKAWVEALPARVWVDWASTVLRLAVGLGFLWEYSWYEMLGNTIARKRVPDTFSELLDAVPVPLPWQSARSATSVRDVGGKIRSKLARGDASLRFIRSQLNQVQSGPGTETLDAIGFLRKMSAEAQGLGRQLLEAKQPPPLVWETVRYGLQTRDSNGPYTDYFGILRTRGTRYLVVDPGTEWIAVIASLTCKEPNGETNVGAVLRNLTRMGLQPEVGDLIHLLEKAGLARGSADADQAVIVQSAF